ncbi:MAG: hypothetical protein ACI9HK_001110 [Pirellulaceae bacterium]
MAHDSHLNQLDDLKVAIITSNHDEWRNRREEVLRMVQDPERESYVRELLASVVQLPPGYTAIAPREVASSNFKLAAIAVIGAVISLFIGLYIGRSLSGNATPRAIVNPDHEIVRPDHEIVRPDHEIVRPDHGDALTRQLANDLDEIQGTWEWDGPEYRMVKVIEGNGSTVKWHGPDGKVFREHVTKLVLARIAGKRFLAFSMTFTTGSRKGTTFSDAYRYDVQRGIFIEFVSGSTKKEWHRSIADPS